MCTFQDYFTYQINIICGIPHVTLEGTIEDWQLLATKIERLLDFDDGTGILVEWVELLRYVSGNLLESAVNGSTNNLAFWDNILYFNNGGGCGPPSIYSGWITVFSFFRKDGSKWDAGAHQPVNSEREPEPTRDVFPTIDSSDVNSNVLSCPVLLNDNGAFYNATLFVGQMSFTYEGGVNDAVVAAQSTSLTESNNVEDDGDGAQAISHVSPVIKPRSDWALVVEKDVADVLRMYPWEAAAFLATVDSLRADVCYWYDNPEVALADNYHRNNNDEGGDGTGRNSNTDAGDDVDTSSSSTPSSSKSSAGVLSLLPLVSATLFIATALVT